MAGVLGCKGVCGEEWGNERWEWIEEAAGYGQLHRCTWSDTPGDWATCLQDKKAKLR